MVVESGESVSSRSIWGHEDDEFGGRMRGSWALAVAGALGVAGTEGNRVDGLPREPGDKGSRLGE